MMNRRLNNVHLLVIIYFICLQKIPDAEGMPFNYDYTDTGTDTGGDMGNSNTDDEVISSIQTLILKLVGKLYNDVDQLDDATKDDLRNVISSVCKYINNVDYNVVKDSIFKIYDEYQKKIRVWSQKIDGKSPFKFYTVK